MQRDGSGWRINLAVCAFGSFTTLVAMTMLVPLLPDFVRTLGVYSDAEVLRWSGYAYSATFLTAALTAPLWGALGDRYGRRSMLLRASLGMAVVTPLIGLSHSVWQLVALRLLTGLMGGYSSGATILVAAQAPEERRGWALGVLSSGILAGSVAGPLIGGTLPAMIGTGPTFIASGAAIFVAFLATAAFVRNVPDSGTATGHAEAYPGRRLPAGVPLLLVTSTMLMFALMSAEPIITVYMGALGGGTRAATWAGVAMALSAAGSVAAAPLLGRVTDARGAPTVIAASLGAGALLLLAQAGAGAPWALCALRLAQGVALAGLTPAVAAAIRQHTPSDRVGRVLGLNVSASYIGQIAGPVLGAEVGGTWGVRAVFVATAAVMTLTLAANLLLQRRIRAGSSEPRSPVRHP
ncbi:MFS transporter [Tsukamurella sp. 8F]|uniref:MFS transporter n=1 Tax=unclassified Tsukamurella TaxID=2633480 RepID=UPI0023BA152B|nr:MULTISPECIES: MFS transporter [unclassified Tsukamurella]MDF0529099.1 MFS transporter [Tsukamurella sp. 8J]MDF0589022.1 MFS transporter [Tsukamurella sp. 8F]